MSRPVTEPAPRPGRLRRLFSGWTLRGFLVAVALAALALGWVEWRVGPQRRAALAIRRAGGTVHYDWQYKASEFGAVTLDGPPRVPTWLIAALGPDYFGEVVHVRLDNREVDRATLEAIGDLSGLRDLDLLAARFRAEDLAALSGLRRLERLSLLASTLDDEGLAHLAGLTTLEFLDLSNTRIGDPGLAALEGMTDLKSLGLNWTAVGDDGMRHLAGMNRLGILGLMGTRITDAGLEHLAGLANLHMLSLDQTRITDAGLKILWGMPGLKILSLSNSNPDPRLTRAAVFSLMTTKPGGINVQYFSPDNPIPGAPTVAPAGGVDAGPARPGP